MRSTSALCRVGSVPDDRYDERSRPHLVGGHFLSPRAWSALDWIAAVVGFVLTELDVHAAGGFSPLNARAILALLASLPIGLRRRFPLLVLLLVGVSTAAFEAERKSSWALSAMLVLAAYTAALQRERSRSIVACAVVAIAARGGAGSFGQRRRPHDRHRRSARAGCCVGDR